MVKCFVTGGTGFVGSHIVRLLVTKGHDVTVLIREDSSLDLLEGFGIEATVGDVTDIDSLRRAIPEDVGWFFHNAAIMADWGGKSHFFPVNVEGTRNVLDVIVEKGITHLLFTSSTALYGFPNTDEPLDEDQEYSPDNWYQKSKLESEKLVWDYRDKYRLKAAAVRPPVVLGHGDMFTGPIFIERIRDGDMYWFSGGENTQSFVHAEDVARALVLAAENMDEADGEAFNVTSFTVEFKKLVEQIRKELEVEDSVKSIPYSVAVGLGKIAGGLYRAFNRSEAPLITAFRVKMLGSRYIIDDSKIREELGYKPAWDLESTVDDIVEWGGFLKPR
ncbi:NAD-dependent epimerase/dehydratase family protein [Candidatus Thorarchaeota archaeon]|nr:MAG: NAD-dependent epimerase/dehydratase family protein [Candidatus Thorarchaeota archaeon]